MKAGFLILMEKRYEGLCNWSWSDGGCLRIKSHRSWLQGEFLDVNRDHVNAVKKMDFVCRG